MSELRLAYPASVLADKPEITAGDVHLLETRVFRPGPSERDDIAVLLALHHSRSRKCAEWEPFFVDLANSPDDIFEAVFRFWGRTLELLIKCK